MSTEIQIVDLPLTEAERDQMIISMAFAMIELTQAIKSLSESLQIMLTLDAQNIKPGVA